MLFLLFLFTQLILFLFKTIFACTLYICTLNKQYFAFLGFILLKSVFFFVSSVKDEESRAAEEYLFEGLASLLSGLGQTLGSQFLPSFTQLHPQILKLATHRKSKYYRCIGNNNNIEILNL